MSEPTVTLQHVRQLKLCAAGARAWCQRNGIDWATLRDTGIPVSELRATGDAFALRACALAEQEAAHGR